MEPTDFFHTVQESMAYNTSLQIPLLKQYEKNDIAMLFQPPEGGNNILTLLFECWFFQRHVPTRALHVCN